MLHGPILKYYESTDLKSTELSKPRNRINLSKEETIADMHVKNKDGAPSNFLLTLNVYAPLGGKRRWEISFKTREQQEEWYEAIRRFDGKPKHRRLPQKKIMFKTYLDEVRTFRRADEVDHVVDSISEINAKVGILSIPLATFLSRDQRDSNVLFAFVLVNGSAITARYGSIGAFWFSIAILNLAVSYLCAHVTTKSIKRLLANNDDGYETDDNDKDTDSPKSFNSIYKAGSTFPRAEAKSEELKKLIEDHGIESPIALKSCASTTTDFEEIPHTYWNVEASRFNLRIGPNYKKNKQKAPSAPALYNLYAMDLVKAQSNLENAERGFQIPDILGVTDVPTGHAYVPPMIVLTVNIPSEEPSMFQSSAVGPSYVAVIYLVITEETRKELTDLENASVAVKLLAEWCQHAEHDDVWKGRFKFLALLDDIENLG